MIKSIKEVHLSLEAEKRYNYIIARVESEKGSAFNLVRIDDNFKTMKILGREITLSRCYEVIKNKEPNGTYIIYHTSIPKTRS